jgi:MFS family permease
VNLGIYLMRHVVGRRSIMMIGSVTQGLCMLIVAITAITSAGTLVARNCLIAFTSLYMFAYNAFVGAASYPVATELVSTRLRSWTVGSAISLGYFLAWLTGFCSPYFINPENMNWVSCWPCVVSDHGNTDEVNRVYRGQSTGTSGPGRTLPAASSFSCACPS